MQRVFITGVSSGIGFALTQEYLASGALVFGVSRRDPRANFRPAGEFRFRSLDLARSECIQPVLHDLVATERHLDLVILNAGILGRIGDMHEVPLDEMKAVMDINLWANKLILDTLFSLPIRVDQVVAISSGAAIAAYRGWNAYSISKAALNMLVALYAAERSNTHFSAFAPGIIDTAMQSQLAAVPDDPRFPSLDSLRAALGTELMPPAESAAPNLIEAFARAQGHPSGAFLRLDQLV